MSDDKFSFEKLRGQENWAIWSDAMQTYLESINCWRILKGIEKRPVVTELANNATQNQKKEHERLVEKQQNWDLREARAKHEINRMVSSDLLYLVADASLRSSGERWAKLEEQFQKETMSNQLTVVTRLIELRMNEEQTIDEYYKQYLEICNRLSALKCEVSEQVKIAVLLRGLPNTFDTIRAAYLARGAFEVSELVESLRSEQLRLKPGQESMQLMKVKKMEHGFKYFRPKTKGPPGSCYVCGKMGHKAKNCWRRKDGEHTQSAKAAQAQNSKGEDCRQKSNGRLMSLIHNELSLTHINQLETTQRTLFIDSGAVLI